MLKRDLGKLLLALEELHEHRVREAMKPKDETVRLSEQETAEALELLCDPRLLERILADFERCGVVGAKQQAPRLPRGRLTQARAALGRADRKLLGGGQILAHGGGPLVRAARSR